LHAIKRHARYAFGLVLFSGGQDLPPAWPGRCSASRSVETIAFDYRQRHRIELDQRLVVLTRVGAAFPAGPARLGDDHFIDMGVLGQISDTSLTRETAFEVEAGRPAEHLRARPQPVVSSHSPPRWRGGAASAIWSAACARPTSRLSRLPRQHHQGACKSRSISAWTEASCWRRR
jgi:hypothetical protein